MKKNQRYELPGLRNRYFALRHGQSEANIQSIIVSDPAVGTKSYGLTGYGAEQVEARLQALPAGLDASLKIVSSDFLRARQTAQIIARGLSTVEPVVYSEKLRERYFGELEAGADSRYLEVWQRDAEDESHRDFGVESARSVVQRTVALVLALDAQYESECILLVAHGDVLQLLQTAFEAVAPSQHRLLPPLAVAEIRSLTPVQGA